MNINIRGNLYDLSSPKIMGILNVTPDSFYDGGKHKSLKEILNHVEKMIEDGMDILDVGGYSSRPGANDITVDEELNRVIPIIKELKKIFPKLIISIDTFRSLVAEKSLDCGIDIINDISSGMLDDNMFNVIGNYQCPYIMMHMQGSPQNMQDNPSYENPSKEIISFLEIEDIKDTPVGKLPYGLQKKVELGRALATDSSLILLDEPMAGMNVEEKRDMCRFILKVNDELGTTMVLIEHDMGVVMDISDRVVVLDYGKVIGDGTPDEVRSNQKVIDAYLGVEH